MIDSLNQNQGVSSNIFLKQNLENKIIKKWLKKNLDKW